MERDNSHSLSNELADSTIFKGDICGPIAATMSESMFLIVISRWRNAFDGLKETNDYKFLSAAGSLMKIMVDYTYWFYQMNACHFHVLFS